MKINYTVPVPPPFDLKQPPQKMHVMAHALFTEAAKTAKALQTTAVAAVGNGIPSQQNYSFQALGDLGAIHSLLVQSGGSPTAAQTAALQLFVTDLITQCSGNCTSDVQAIIDGMSKDFTSSGTFNKDPTTGAYTFINDWIQPSGTTTFGGAQLAFKFFGSLTSNPSNPNPFSGVTTANPLGFVGMMLFMSDMMTVQTASLKPTFDASFWGPMGSNNPWANPIPFSDLFPYITSVGFYQQYYTPVGGTPTTPNYADFMNKLNAVAQALPTVGMIQNAYPKLSLVNYQKMQANFGNMISKDFPSPSPTFPPPSWKAKYPQFGIIFSPPTHFGKPPNFETFFRIYESAAMVNFVNTPPI